MSIFKLIIFILFSNYQLILNLQIFSPSPSLKSKQIASQDDIGTQAIENEKLQSGGTAIRTSIRDETPTVIVSNSITNSTNIATNILPPGGGSGSVTLPVVVGTNGSLTKSKKSLQTLNFGDYQQSMEMDPLSFISSSAITDSGNSESSEPPTSICGDSLSSSNQLSSNPQIVTQSGCMSLEMGHSRNSSNTSQVSIFICMFLNESVANDKR